MRATVLVLMGLFVQSASFSRAADTPPGTQPAPTIPTPQWIWSSPVRDGSGQAKLMRSFTLDKPIARAELRAVGDFCDARIIINDKRAVWLEPYDTATVTDCTALLQQGDNRVLIDATGVDGPSAAAIVLVVTFKDGSMQILVTDASWRAGDATAATFGHVAEEPFGHTLATGDDHDRIEINRFDDYEQWRQATGAEAGADPSTFYAAPGFEIELVKSASADEGSWVGIATDPKGRLIIAREDQGLLRMTIAAGKGPARVTRVETINDKLKECRGLLFVGNDLYVHANNTKGLYRLRDTKLGDGDDQYDEVTLLHESPGGVGHGRNDLALGADGFAYAIQGDSVELPKGFIDHLSPLRHNGIPAGTEGHVYRFDPNQSQDKAKWELLTAGLRNPFGIAFNSDGEAFTYDADAEHDMGAPWYRPTYVRHLVPGVDFGWRAVTGKWPPYYIDHADEPPVNFNVGKGSPTGVRFGGKSDFPQPWRDALYILDWAYGRILAIHVEPRGASYTCSAQTLLKGRPLNVTNLDFGPDGAMYFVTGGRRTKAALYRVRYTGPRPSLAPPGAQQTARRAFSNDSRMLRHQLEALHRPLDEKVLDIAWPQLADADPWIRQVARVAIEHQPVEMWRARALAETNVTAALQAMLSLASTGARTDADAAARKVLALPLDKLPEGQLRIALRVLTLATTSGDPPSEALEREIVARISPLYPHASRAINFDLAMLLAPLRAPDYVHRTIALLDHAADSREQLHYLFLLRNQRAGWSLDDRHAYFASLATADTILGGAGMPDFLKRIRAEAKSTLTTEERTALGDIVDGKQTIVIAEPAPPRAFVKKWTAEELARNFDSATGDPAKGRKLFDEARCVLCHRMGRRGGVIGPDLTNVGSRFDRHALIESMIEPSRVVAEPYRSVAIETTDGRRLIGRLAPGGDYRASNLAIVLNPLTPDDVTQIAKKDIISHEEVMVSPMPTGLLDTFSQQEVRDLIAYLIKGE